MSTITAAVVLTVNAAFMLILSAAQQAMPTPYLSRTRQRRSMSWHCDTRYAMHTNPFTNHEGPPYLGVLDLAN